MGGSHWSNDAYSDRVSTRSLNKVATFDYNDKVKSGQVEQKVHSSLDPRKLKGKVRESRDSEAHPESNAIYVSLDVTGSMSRVLTDIQKKLPSLMGMLLQKGYIKDPQVLFAAVGDADSDDYPLQVGQFESGIEMEDNVTTMILEGGGGGTKQESYELNAWVGARKTAIDCLEKRGKKGYFFFIGDEKTYNHVKRDQVEALVGEDIGEDIPVAQIFKELQEKYNVFFVLPRDASHGNDQEVIDWWSNLIGGQHVLRLPKASHVAELIATQIGLLEGTTDGEKSAQDMKEHGLSASEINSIKSAVVVPASMSGILEGSKAPVGVEVL